MLGCEFWWSGLTTFLFYHDFSFEKSRRCYNNQQITVSHFGEHKRLHLESSKQNYYIISFTSNNKSNLHAFSRWGGEPKCRRDAHATCSEIPSQEIEIMTKSGDFSWRGSNPRLCAVCPCSSNSATDYIKRFISSVAEWELQGPPAWSRGFDLCGAQSLDFIMPTLRRQCLQNMYTSVKIN